MAVPKLPVGIDSFEKIRLDECYYVDKSNIISRLLEKGNEITLFTRPRRFGKTLMMSMLEHFFDITKNSNELFKGLNISGNADLCRKWMNQYPVLFLTLKDVSGPDFESAYGLLQYIIAQECIDRSYLESSPVIDEARKEAFRRLKMQQGTQTDVIGSLDTLMRMLHSYYGKPVILLIDEYDVPLSKANDGGYYSQMLGILRSMLSLSLKTNPALKFAVVTGCLRIAKESIFTGTNNFAAYSVLDQEFSDCFGFTEAEAGKILQDTGFHSKKQQMKEWYNGYHFGKQEVYCPWDVLNYVSALQSNPDAEPKNYWENTSHNNIIRSFVDHTEWGIESKFEVLLNGGSITETITDNLTYDTLHTTEENLWSVLFMTGYLTTAENDASVSPRAALKIPNREIMSIFEKTVVQWFRDGLDISVKKELFDALWKGDAKKATDMISDLLFQTISYHDYHEDYYHAFIMGLFIGAGYPAESNREHGLGRTDITITDKRNRRAILIEAKKADSEADMKAKCKEAFDQIREKQYARDMLSGYREVLCYGMAFFRKSCLVEKMNEAESFSCK